jgi:hypothetical protein
MRALREHRGIYWTRAGAGIAIAAVGAVAFFCLPVEASAGLPGAFAHFGIGLGGIMVLVGVGLVIAAVPEH